ncbi:MAG: amidohydrolase, partial [Ignavibacteriae bacterium]|nr:amidohydrolase [Ignavibacteriota bacterium]
INYYFIMNYFKLIFVLAISLIIFSCSKNPATVYYNGKIYTLDKNNTIVEAVAVKDGKIIETGKSEELKDKYGKDKLIDLKGKTVIPGFIESEGSLVDFSLELSRFNNMADLRNVISVEKIVSIVSEKVKTQKEDTWVGGYGWDEENVSEGIELINKSTLDKISTKHNIYLINKDGTIVWCNTRAIDAMQITNKTPSPEGGEISKDEKGELDGLLFGKAVNLVKEKLPKFTKEDMQTALKNGAQELLKYGITGVVDRNLSKESINAYKELIDSNKIPIHIYAVLTGGDEAFTDYLQKGIEANYKDKLTVRAVTLDYDGAFELQSAAMNENYKMGSKKKPYTDEATIEKTLRDALDKNFQFTIKTVGDEAVTKALNVIEKVIKEKNPKDARIKIEGVEFINQNDLKRIKDLKIIPSIRPETNIFDSYYLDLMVTPDTKKKFALWNSLLASGGLITTASGFPFSLSINPLTEIYYLTSRQPIDTNLTNIPNPEHKLTVLDAIKSYTIWAAYSTFQEDTKGSLEKGKFADMVVLSDDIFNITGKALLNTKVFMTIVNGIVVYENKDNVSK